MGRLYGKDLDAVLCRGYRRHECVADSMGIDRCCASGNEVLLLGSDQYEDEHLAALYMSSRGPAADFDVQSGCCSSAS
jgi:hypothetical protein